MRMGILLLLGIVFCLIVIPIINALNIELGEANLTKESDPFWTSNFSNMQTDCSSGNYVYGISSNGFFKCRNDETGTDNKWTLRAPWLYNLSNQATFNDTRMNETINSYFISVYFNATSASLIKGTIDGGTIENTQHPDGNYDDKTINFSEESGSPGLDMRINFTNIDTFNRGVIRYRTSSLSGDFPIIQMWDYVNDVWIDYPAVAESDSFVIITQPVFKADNLIGTGDNNGVVQMRLYKASNGNTQNHYYVDWIAIAKGPGVPSGQEVDPEFKIWLKNPVVDSLNVSLNLSASEVWNKGDKWCNSTSCYSLSDFLTGGGGAGTDTWWNIDYHTLVNTSNVLKVNQTYIELQNATEWVKDSYYNKQTSNDTYVLRTGGVADKIAKWTGGLMLSYINLTYTALVGDYNHLLYPDFGNFTLDSALNDLILQGKNTYITPTQGDVIIEPKDDLIVNSPDDNWFKTGPGGISYFDSYSAGTSGTHDIVRIRRQTVGGEPGNTFGPELSFWVCNRSMSCNELGGMKVQQYKNKQTGTMYISPFLNGTTQNVLGISAINQSIFIQNGWEILMVRHNDALGTINEYGPRQRLEFTDQPGSFNWIISDDAANKEIDIVGIPAGKEYAEMIRIDDDADVGDVICVNSSGNNVKCVGEFRKNYLSVVTNFTAFVINHYCAPDYNCTNYKPIAVGGTMLTAKAYCYDNDGNPLKYGARMGTSDEKAGVLEPAPGNKDLGDALVGIARTICKPGLSYDNITIWRR